MDYYSEVCNLFIRPKSEYKHFKSNVHKKIDKYKHIILTIETLNLSGLDSIFYSYITGHIKKPIFFLRNANLN